MHVSVCGYSCSLLRLYTLPLELLAIGSRQMWMYSCRLLMLSTLALELLAIGRRQMWMLGSELGFPAKAKCARNCWTTFPAKELCIFKLRETCTEYFHCSCKKSEQTGKSIEEGGCWDWNLLTFIISFSLIYNNINVN